MPAVAVLVAGLTRRCEAAEVTATEPGPTSWHSGWVTDETQTPDAYVAAVPDDRRELIDALRATILEHLPEGFEETIEFGMLSYVVPLDRCADTYNGRPLPVVSLANQKRYVSLYLMGVYADDAERDWFVDAWTRSGKRLDMGRSCVRVKRVDDVPFDVVAQAVGRVSIDDLIAAHDRAHDRG